MAYKLAAAILLVVLAVTPIYAVRDLKQFTVGNQMTFQQPHQLVHTHMQAKKDVAMHMIDHAKSFAHDMSKGKGKGAPVVASLPTTYVVTSQPQIVVAPMPQLAPTPVVASAPQVQAPAPPPPPPEIRYVPVKETVVKPVIVPIPIPKIKPIIPKHFFKKAIAKAIGAELIGDHELELVIEDDHESVAPTEVVTVEATKAVESSKAVEPSVTVQTQAPVPVPTAPAEVLMTPAPAANPTAPNPTAAVATAATTPAATPAAAGPMPASTSSTIIASARTAQPMQQPVQATAALTTGAPPTFQPMQVVEVQNQVNRQGQIVGQMYGVAAAGR